VSVQELSFPDAWVEVGAADGAVTFEVSTVDIFEMAPSEAVALSRALVKAAGEALGISSETG